MKTLLSVTLCLVGLTFAGNIAFAAKKTRVRAEVLAGEDQPERYSEFGRSGSSHDPIVHSPNASSYAFCRAQLSSSPDGAYSSGPDGVIFDYNSDVPGNGEI